MKNNNIMKINKISMSEPKTDYSDPVQGIIQELISATSALNMYPNPIENAEGFLSETDTWAKESYNHIQAALDMALKLQRKRGRYEN